MAEFRLIPVDHASAWCNALTKCGRFDSYHLVEYHLLARQQGEGDPYLLFFEEDGCYAALPFLLRSLDAVEGLKGCQHRDAASAYGYPGLLTSIGRTDANTDAFRKGFQTALHQAFKELQVITFFGRQNPLIDSSWLFPSEAQLTVRGSTVAINLAQPEEDRLQDMRENHRRDIRRARQAGMTVKEDPGFRRIDSFRRLYYETMERTGAAEHYFFPEQYFTDLKRCLNRHVKLFFAEQDGSVISGSLFLLSGDIIQYHLGGTATEFLKRRGGVKMIFEEVRAWGSRNGFAWMHLGGGLGGREDTLFSFKAGFSKTRCPFETVNMVLEPEIYQQLTRRRANWARHYGYRESDGRYFPGYRQPYEKHAA